MKRKQNAASEIMPETEEEFAPEAEAVSAHELTGLIPSAPESEFESESYDTIMDTTPEPVADND